jgi:Tfp pilus assembly pilus retraction ATPase PilT
MALQDLLYSDLFVADEAASSWYKSTPDSMVTTPVPADCAVELQALRHALEERATSAARPAFRIQWPEDNGVDLRVGLMRLASGQSIFVCRRFRVAASSLVELGVPDAFASQFMAESLTEGLVVFLGKAGSGKTTTAASFVKERLTRFGGVCWSVENPIELPLEGRHGRGWCYQTEVASDAHIGGATRDMLRASPNIIFIGELRDPLAVREAITASTSGHLVVTTFHAGDLVSGLARLSALANNDKVSAALADSLRVAAHLSLRNAVPGHDQPRGTGTPPRVLSVEPMWIKGGESDSLQSIIRKGDFHMLKSEVQRQLRAAMTARGTA